MDDMKLLLVKQFLLECEGGVVVIRHWRIHNYIQSDRYNPSKLIDAKEQLTLNANKEYEYKSNASEIQAVGEMDTGCIQNGYNMDTQVRLGKDRLDKVSLGKDNITASEDSSATKPKPQKHRYGEYNHVLLTDAEHEKLEKEFGLDMTTACITYLDEYIEMKGYKAKSHYLAIRKWVLDAVHKHGKKKTQREESAQDEFRGNVRTKEYYKERFGFDLDSIDPDEPLPFVQ